MSKTALRELLYGKGAHADPLACIEDLSAALAGQKIAAYPHSVWQIVWHMNYWMDYELNRIEGHSKTYPEHAIESWPASAEPSDENAWQSAVSEFRNLLAKFVELSELDANALERKIPGTHDIYNPQTVTLHTILWQLVAHNSYHAGQIALLRRALGAWPPRNGSDTW